MSRCTVVRNEEEYNFVLNFYQLDIVDIYLNLLLLGFFIFLDLFLKLIIFLVLQLGFVIREVGAVRISDTKRIIIRHFVNLRESTLKWMIIYLLVIFACSFTIYN